MTLQEQNKFYKNDQKEYKLSKNKDFLSWYYNNQKNMTIKMPSLEELQDLIWKITKWYEFKYPNRVLSNEIGLSYIEFSTLKKITQEMTINQLRYQLNNNQLQVLDCPYQSEPSEYQILKNQEGIWTKYITINIKDKITKRKKEYLITAKEGKIKLKKETINIEELYQKLKVIPNIDTQNLEEIINNHKIMIELRNKIITYTIKALIYSKSTIPEYGEERSNYLIKELEEYYQIKLPSLFEQIPNQNHNTIKDKIKTKILITKINNHSN